MFKQIYLTHRGDPNKNYHSGVREDLEVKAMNWFSTIHRSFELEPHYQVQFILRKEWKIVISISELTTLQDDVDASI